MDVKWFFEITSGRRSWNLANSSRTTMFIDIQQFLYKILFRNNLREDWSQGMLAIFCAESFVFQFAIRKYKY
jgi:hypothetical protein